MQSVRLLTVVAGLAASAGAVMLMSCEKEPAPASPASNPRSSSNTDDHEHSPDDGHDHGAAKTPGGTAAGDGHDHKPGDNHNHDHAAGDGHDHDHDHGHGHGPTTELGTQSVGGFVVDVSRDGDVTAGGESSFDISITGSAVKPAAVRLWIGAQDGKGSMKAKAEAAADGWHAHVEVPNPMPGESKLWVEIETDKGEKIVTGFDLQV